MTTPPKTLTQEESFKILNVLAQQPDTPIRRIKAIRNVTIVTLMLDAGLRVGEVIKLAWSDLYFGNDPVRAIEISDKISKSKKPRTIPVAQRLYTTLVLYAEAIFIDEKRSETPFAFTSTKTRFPLTVRQVERIVAAASRSALGRPVHPHIFRHTFATRLMRKTNAATVQALLGHESLTSTQIYMHPNGDDLKSAIDSIA